MAAIRTVLRQIVTDMDDLNGELQSWLADRQIDRDEFALLQAYHLAMCKRADLLDGIEAKLSEIEKAPKELQSFEATTTKAAVT